MIGLYSNSIEITLEGVRQIFNRYAELKNVTVLDGATGLLSNAMDEVHEGELTGEDMRLSARRVREWDDLIAVAKDLNSRGVVFHRITAR